MAYGWKKKVGVPFLLFPKTLFQVFRPVFGFYRLLEPLKVIGDGLAELVELGPEPEFASPAAIWRSGFPEALESRARNSRRRL